MLTALLILVLLFVIGKVAGGGSSTTTATSPAAPASSSSPGQAQAPAPAPAAPQAAGLNTPVSDGQFQFTVTKVDCGQPSIGSGALKKNAQGQFCLVSVSVKNTGNKAQYLDSSSQKASNAQGQQYSADGSAAMYLEQGSNTFLNQINPGNSVNGTIVFDIPKDAKITNIQLHDSPFSGGVTVSL